MPGIARIGIDTAGGGIILSNASSAQVYINGSQAALKGAIVQNHSGHTNVTMVGSSTSVFINGLGVVRQGDLASCGHVATASGSIAAA